MEQELELQNETVTSRHIAQSSVGEWKLNVEFETRNGELVKFSEKCTGNNLSGQLVSVSFIPTSSQMQVFFTPHTAFSSSVLDGIMTVFESVANRYKKEPV